MSGVDGRRGLGGGGELVKLEREAKNTSKKYDSNSSAVWKQLKSFVLPNLFLLINNKAPKVLDAQV